MRYFCESSSESIGRVTHSISTLDAELETRDIIPQSILDLGCGNGRNSIYFAKKYGSAVTAVDNDISMLKWTEEAFRLQELKCHTIHSSIEELTRYLNPSETKFDIVILSYVMQHIDPVYYPFILDFCRDICSRFLIIDVFWNPRKVLPNQLIQIDSINWYGLTYEEIFLLVAPRFRLLGHNIHRTDIAVIINLVMELGETNISTVLSDVSYYTSQRLRIHSNKIERVTRSPPKIDEFTSIKLLGLHYSSQFDLVKQEISDWIVMNPGKMSNIFMASKFLYLCRINKIPVTFREVARDFNIPTKALMHILYTTEYVPPLNVGDYVKRCSKILKIPDSVTNTAIELIDINRPGGLSPSVLAGVNIVKAAKIHEFKIKKTEVAGALNISPVAINLHLEKEIDESENQNQRTMPVL